MVWTAPLEVWVNGRSASSSEVLAGALHDNCRASVVGSSSYGKGLIQGVFGLSDGGALVTTAVKPYPNPNPNPNPNPDPDPNPTVTNPDQVTTVASYATPSGRDINVQGAPARSWARPYAASCRRTPPAPTHTARGALSLAQGGLLLGPDAAMLRLQYWGLGPVV